MNRYLDGCPLVRQDGARASATVRQILTHTAGIGVHGFDGYTVGTELPTTAQILAGTPPCNSPKICQEYTPGEHWCYSGGGFMVLQKCVENITDTEFAVFMDSAVLSPLGMEDSSFRQNLTENLAKGHTQNFTPVPGGHNLMPEQAAAGLWTTAADLAKFGLHLQNILRGQIGLIPQALAMEMITPQCPDVLDLEGTRCCTGLGCYLKDIGGSPYFGHGGENEGFESLANFSVNGGNGCCVMVNSNDGYPLTLEVQKEILG